MRQALRVFMAMLTARPMRFALLVLAVLVPAHDLVYLVGYGIADHDRALAESGHGVPWHALGYATALAVIAAVAVAAQRWTALQRRVAQLGLRVAPLPTRTLAWRICRLGLALLATSLAVFATQENLEHLSQHADHLPGLTVLFHGEFQWTLPVFTLLSFTVAAAGSVAVHRFRALAAAISRAMQATPRPAKALPRPAEVDLPPWASARFAPRRGRAPPLPVA